MDNSQSRRYLGDSVYAHFEDGTFLRIYLDNGEGPKHEIALEPAVFQELIRYGEKCWPGITDFVTKKD